MSYIETYYRRGLAEAAPRSSLAGEQFCDVAIVGGGLAGLTTALELQRRGRSVCLLEGQRVAWGASGRNGGFVSPGYSARYKLIEARVGPGHAKDLHRMSIEGMHLVDERLKSTPDAVARRTPGIIGAVRYDARDGLLAHRDWLEREFDHVVTFLDRDEVQQ